MMPMLCVQCGTTLRPVADRSVYVASEFELRHPTYNWHLRKLVANSNLKRRAWRDAISDSICRFDRRNGKVMLDRTRKWDVPLVDDVFPDDPDDRWLSNFAKVPPHPVAVVVQAASFPRIQLLDLYFRIENPSQIFLMQSRIRAANDNSIAI